eukprot:4082947-Pyramimonas_sp.AAC.1
MMRRRAGKVTKLLSDDASVQACVSIALLSEPVDELTSKLLHLDCEGRLLMDLMSASSPIEQCQSQLHDELRPESSVYRLMSNHFSMMSADSKRALAGTVRSIVVELSGSVHTRLFMYFDRYPFVMVKAVNGTLLPDDVSRDLFDTPECCLDPGFSEKVKRWCSSDQARFREPTMLDLLRSWATFTKVTVAHIERMHAINKHAFTG